MYAYAVSGPLSILDYKQPVEFRIGDVLVKSWGALTRHFLTFFLLAGNGSFDRLVRARQQAEIRALDGREWQL